ncbi:MAG: LysM peptidoglycan-binding domain-containing protein [Polyangiales bacterium]
MKVHQRIARRRAWVALSAAAAGSSAWLASASATAQEMQEYRVQPGDTCPSIAQRLYGDVGRIDLIHQNNANLGRLPHRLQPGQILRLPRTATGGRAASTDARVSFVRNEVDAYTPEQHRAQRNEGLSRGHRLGTLDASSAEVLFIDETQLQLGPNTLVVILGRAAQCVDAGGGSEARLERGTLRASLAALSGQAPAAAPRQITVQTPAAVAQVGAGTSLVDVDARRTTRLAVHQGTSNIRAAGRTVQVNEGFGSRADRGRAPRPPQPLPGAPAWASGFAPLVLVSGDDRASVRGSYARATSGPTPVVWHVQLARDAQFNDLIVDARVPAAVTNLDAQLLPGAYFARVSAVDADGFEGRPSAVATMRVSSVLFDRGGPGRRASVRVSEGTMCSLDGAAMARVTAPLELRPLARHTLRCAADESGAGAVERAWGADESGVVTVRSRVFGAQYEGDRGSRRILVGVLDAVGHPVAGARLRAESPRGITLDAVRPGAEPGTYETVARWTGAAPAGTIRFFVDGEAEPRASLELDSTRPPAERPAPAQPPRPHVGLELAFEGDAMITFDPRFRSGLGVALEARARIPAGPGLLLGMRAGYLRFGCSGPQISDLTVYCAPESTATPGAPRTSVGVDTFDIGPLVGGYFARHNAPVTGYLGFVPQWVMHRSVVSRPDGTEALEASSTFGILSMLGAQLRIGPGGLYAHVGYRGTVANTQGLGPLPIGGMLFALGYRALF